MEEYSQYITAEGTTIIHLGITIKQYLFITVEEEYSQYITGEDALILHLRVEMLMQENCEECTPGDVTIKQYLFITVEEEYSQYITGEDALILHLRVEMLMQENCEEWALNLCNCCLQQEKFRRDLEFKMMQLMLLFKLKYFDKLQEVVRAYYTFITCFSIYGLKYKSMT